MYLEMKGARVQELREDKGLSKRGLADVASISMSTARRVEGEDLSNCPPPSRADVSSRYEYLYQR